MQQDSHVYRVQKPSRHGRWFDHDGITSAKQKHVHSAEMTMGEAQDDVNAVRSGHCNCKQLIAKVSLRQSDNCVCVSA